MGALPGGSTHVVWTLQIRPAGLPWHPHLMTPRHGSLGPEDLEASSCLYLAE